MGCYAQYAKGLAGRNSGELHRKDAPSKPRESQQLPVSVDKAGNLKSATHSD